MSTTTTKSLRRAAFREMRTKQDAELANGIEALARATKAPDVLHALSCIGGRELPLPLPTGADLTFREDLARYCAQRIERRIVDELDQHFIAFDVASEGWVCPAHHAFLRLKQMQGVVTRRFKRALPKLLYAPVPRIRREPGRPVELAPAVRIFALVNNADRETVERSVSAICRELDPRGTERWGAPTVQPVVPSTVAREVTRILTLSSTVNDRASSGSPVSNNACVGALIRMTIAATMPYKTIAGGIGTMKAEVKHAMARAKAAAVARHGDGPSPIAKSELYPALGDMMPEVNGERMRLPFCLL